MKRTSTLLAAVLVPLVLVLPGHAVPGGDVGPYDPIPMAPVLVFDVSGSTLGGPVARNLVIYSNGRVQISQAAGFLSEPYVFAKTLSQGTLHGVLGEIDRWSHLKDEQPQVMDIPLQTLTRIGADGKSWSVSWWIGTNAHDHFEDAIDRLVVELFPQIVD